VRRPLAIALPCLSGLAGFVILTAHPSDVLAVVGAVLLGAAFIAAIAFIVLRLGPDSGPDRAREERARDELDATGRWPED
jgi:hypothetical protein